jgi:hypothetical protein
MFKFRKVDSDFYSLRIENYNLFFDKLLKMVFNGSDRYV